MSIKEDILTQGVSAQPAKQPIEARPLQRGDLVEVLSAGEILQTLDERGELDGLLFMPEMIASCGARFTVTARAESVCDTIGWGIRRYTDTVLLGDHRCDGGGHGGCEAECRTYWKERWLRRVTPGEPPGVSHVDQESVAALLKLASENTTRGDGSTTVSFRCQATEARQASVQLSAKDPRPYARQYKTGNVSLAHFIRVMGRAVVLESAKRLRLLPDPPVRGTGPKSPKTPTLGLQPGEWVKVKERDEIEATLNDKGKNRGLWFDREMLAFCGKVFRVRRQINRLIDERTGEMLELSSDCVTLEGAVCSGDNSLGRWFCPRAIYPYWREAWLDRVDTESAP
jgi:hypothetical protein